MDQPLILQSQLPLQPWTHPRTARLPGVNPLDWDDWLLVDDAYAAQMALKDRLLAEITPAVLADGAGEPAAEHLSLMLPRLARKQGFTVDRNGVTRPDGVRVPLDGSALVTAARLVQQDLCIMEKRGDEHVLTAAALCFPSNWRLTDKIGRPMIAIHAPVPHYDAALAARVQRIFDAMHPDRPVWRMNYLLYANPELHQPRRLEGVTRENGRFVRCERQTLVKLPNTGAIVFGIHNIVVELASLTEADRAVFLDVVKPAYR